MLQLRCTAKAQKALGINPSDLAEVKQGESLLGNWYINTFTVDHRKTFIFVNEKTLLSFVIFGIKKSNVNKTPEAFFHGLHQLLTIEGFELDDINNVFRGYDCYEYTKTTSRKVLGNMNDLVDLYRHYILHDGGFKYASVGEIILHINKTPQRNLGWSNAIEMTKALLLSKQIS